MAAWSLSALTVWSCASDPDPGADPGNGGAPTVGGEGGAGASTAGTPSAAGGAAGNQAGGGQSGAAAGSITAGVSGGGVAGSSQGGTSSAGMAGEPAGGMGGSGEGGAGQAGSGEGGAGGSGDSVFDGRCGEGWAAGGSAPSPELEGNVIPEQDRSGNWSFTFGRYRFVVAGARGARIVELSLDGANLLDPSAGSTFWPSPQQAYTWPPPAELDSEAYEAEADGATLTLTSDVSARLGMSLRKRFWANEASGVVSIEYELINEAAESASWAPWEVTRVRAGGYTFAPKGRGNRTITQDSWQRPLPLTVLPPAPAAGGIAWLDYPSLSLTQDNYIAEFDGAEGWLGHANRIGKSLLPVLFVKSFADAADATLPPNQAEIQLWTSGTANPKLIEVEQQGALEELEPGQSLRWTVRWSACELPSSQLLSAGSKTLASLARAHAIAP